MTESTSKSKQESKPPIGKSWNQIYWIVGLFLLVEIFLFTVLTLAV